MTDFEIIPATDIDEEVARLYKQTEPRLKVREIAKELHESLNRVTKRITRMADRGELELRHKGNGDCRARAKKRAEKKLLAGGNIDGWESNMKDVPDLDDPAPYMDPWHDMWKNYGVAIYKNGKAYPEMAGTAGRRFLALLGVAGV